MEDGDALYIPPQPKSVLVLGAVRNSTALLHTGAEERPEFYIAQAGGATREADLDQMYVLKPDGSTISSFPKVYNVEAGDTIIVPLSTEPKFRTLPMLRDIATILTGFRPPVRHRGGVVEVLTVYRGDGCQQAAGSRQQAVRRRAPKRGLRGPG